MPSDYFSEIRRSQVGTFRFHTFPTETNCRDERYGDDSAQKRAQDVANEDGSSTARKVEARCRDHTQGGLLCRLPNAVGSVKTIHLTTCFAHNCFAEKAVFAKHRLPLLCLGAPLRSERQSRLAKLGTLLIESLETPSGLGIGTNVRFCSGPSSSFHMYS